MITKDAINREMNELKAIKCSPACLIPLSGFLAMLLGISLFIATGNGPWVIAIVVGFGLCCPFMSAHVLRYFQSKCWESKANPPEPVVVMIHHEFI